MGVGNNFIFAFLILLLAALIYGAPSTAPKISDVTAGMPSEQVGIEKGDIVKEINGHKIEFLEDISLYLTISDLSKPVDLTVQKTTGNIEKYTVVPQKVTDDEGNTKYAVGLVLSPEIHKGFLNSIKYAFNEERAIFKQMFVVLGNLFTGGVKVSQLSGPVGIFNIVGQTKEVGLAALFSLTALLSINVGVINLLPFGSLFAVGSKATPESMMMVFNISPSDSPSAYSGRPSSSGRRSAQHRQQTRVP